MMAHDEEVALREALAVHRAEVLDRWRDLVFASYPDEAVRFFRREKDGFKNPVGQSILQSTAAIFNGALMAESPEGVPEALEAIVRIRAVQELSPAEAVGFVFQLKRAVREVMEASRSRLSLRLQGDLDARVDALALSAFEIYTRCRDQVSEIRVHEAQRRTAGLLRRFNREHRPEDDSESGSGAAADRRREGVPS